MRKCSTCQVEIAEEICPKRLLELLRRNVGQIILHFLAGGIVHQDIELMEVLYNLFDKFVTKRGIAYIPWIEDAFGPFLLDAFLAYSASLCSSKYEMATSAPSFA